MRARTTGLATAAALMVGAAAFAMPNVSAAACDGHVTASAASGVKVAQLNANESLKIKEDKKRNRANGNGGVSAGTTGAGGSAGASGGVSASPGGASAGAGATGAAGTGGAAGASGGASGGAGAGGGG